MRSRRAFQSSPGPEARCYAGVTLSGCPDLVVSILTGPGGPVLQALNWDLYGYGLVSILTGPGGPVLRRPLTLLGLRA